jgi:hypothetical protein
VLGRHAALEVARTHAHERDAVAVHLVHVRGDLVDEAREERRVRRHHAVQRRQRSRRRRDLEEALQDVLDAEVHERTAEEHRRDLLLQEGLHLERLHAGLDHREVLEQLPVRAFAESRGQHGVGRTGRLHQGLRRVVGRALEQEHLLVAQRVDAAEAVARADRPRRRHDRDAEHLLDLVHEVERRARWPVHLVDDRDDRDAAVAAHLEQLDRLRFDALGAVDQHQRSVGRDQRAEGVLAEVLVARRVEQVDAVALILELQRRARDRDAALLLELHPVRRRVRAAAARLDRARPRGSRRRRAAASRSASSCRRPGAR